MIIAYTGTHGTGKTTAVYERAAKLKKEHPDKTVGILAEVAARAPYPINLDGTLASQMWIFTRQISAELSLLAQYDIVVTDRTAVDPIAYTAALGMDVASKAMLELVSHHMHHYDEINFLLTNNNCYYFEDGVREATDAKFRMDVEGILRHFYDRLGLFQEERFKWV